jgi:hypothetical protein
MGNVLGGSKNMTDGHIFGPGHHRNGGPIPPFRAMLEFIDKGLFDIEGMAS